jgi:hypothetical protein
MWELAFQLGSPPVYQFSLASVLILQQVYFFASISANLWDDGYPSGGNYWSNYTGLDLDHDEKGSRYIVT